jgi:3-hydroxyisobutyrate dehydrogenase-like beta-hydroxyacid dehydrogenase
LGIIGFGEVGKTLSQGFAPAFADIAVYDILFDDKAAGPGMKAKARELGVTAVEKPQALCGAGRLLISCVTAGSAVAVAENAASWLKPGQVLLDINSVSPDCKREAAQAIEGAGGRYVEGVVMSPIHPKGHASPMLLGGPHAADFAAFAKGLGMNVTVEDAEVGRASANKMCRSIMVKGIEALVVECFATARHYGVEDKVIASLNVTFPNMDWEKAGAYMLERVLTHGKRRAEEMRFSARTVKAAGLEPLMAAAIAERQQWVVDHVPQKEARALGQEPLPVILDRLGKAFGKP